MKKTGMVDVGEKNKTERIAKARGYIKLNKEIADKIKDNDIPKGNILETARMAGILGAKKTSDLIPEIRKEENIKKSLISFFYFLIGIAIMYLIKIIGS